MQLYIKFCILCRSKLLPVTPLEESQFLTVNTDLTPQLAAKDYQGKSIYIITLSEKSCVVQRSDPFQTK